ncbi:mitochondrial assembly of ribosomal large subunit protein 1 isoform X2 [Rhinoraja longicauda]
MRKVVAALAALAGCGARSMLRAARDPGQRALLCPDPRARVARGARAPGLRLCSGEHMDRCTTEEPGSIYQPVFNIDVLVALLRQENANEICVIKLPTEIKYADYFIVASGTSARHLQAMAQYAVKVHKHLKREENDHVHIEGKDTDDWKCIDFGKSMNWRNSGPCVPTMISWLKYPWKFFHWILYTNQRMTEQK